MQSRARLIRSCRRQVEWTALDAALATTRRQCRGAHDRAIRPALSRVACHWARAHGKAGTIDCRPRRARTTDEVYCTYRQLTVAGLRRHVTCDMAYYMAGRIELALGMGRAAPEYNNYLRLPRDTSCRGVSFIRNCEPGPGRRTWARQPRLGRRRRRCGWLLWLARSSSWSLTVTLPSGSGSPTSEGCPVAAVDGSSPSYVGRRPCRLGRPGPQARVHPGWPRGRLPAGVISGCIRVMRLPVAVAAPELIVVSGSDIGGLLGAHRLRVWRHLCHRDARRALQHA